MTSPDAVPLRLEAPDVTFQLSPQDRAELAPVFDADALERLLREIRPDMRGEILAYFQKGKSPSRGHLVEIFDPHLQTILEEVWAPFWADAPDQALDENWYGMPGREIAKARRAAARERAQQQPPQPKAARAPTTLSVQAGSTPTFAATTNLWTTGVKNG